MSHRLLFFSSSSHITPHSVTRHDTFRSHVTCNLSRVSGHMSPAICHASHTHITRNLSRVSHAYHTYFSHMSTRNLSHVSGPHVNTAVSHASLVTCQHAICHTSRTHISTSHTRYLYLFSHQLFYQLFRYHSSYYSHFTHPCLFPGNPGFPHPSSSQFITHHRHILLYTISHMSSSDLLCKFNYFSKKLIHFFLVFSYSSVLLSTTYD